jgi:pimeloyl-ACP methyl ester carboxylesterase
VRHDGAFDTSHSRAGSCLHREAICQTNRQLARRCRNKCCRSHATRHNTWDCPSYPRGGTRPICPCGLSMGGYIAFETMRQAPNRAERLALLDTTALSDSPEQTERGLKLIALAQAGEFNSVCDTLWPLFVHPARHGDAVLKRAVFKMMNDTGPEIFVRQQKAIISRPDSRSSLGAIHCPTLVLVGNEDVLTPVSAARTILDGIAGSKLHIVPGCGHLSTMEQPDAVTKTLRAWLAL